MVLVLVMYYYHYYYWYDWCVFLVVRELPITSPVTRYTVYGMPFYIKPRVRLPLDLVTHKKII
jgi:hypothetical protein